MTTRRRKTTRRRATARRRTTHRARPNPSASGRLAGAVLMSGRVVAVEYRHAQSATRAPYRHDFAAGVELWALADGTVLLRHPTKPLHAEYLVPNSE